MLQHMASRKGRDDFISDFPFIGGKPGPRAMLFTTVWIISLVAPAFSILLCFITMQFVLAVVLIIMTAIVGCLPTFFLIGSRI